MHVSQVALPILVDMEIWFIISPDRFPEISIITNHIMDLIYGRWHHLLKRYNHDFLSPPKLLQYAEAIEQVGAALNNCWGFVDGTMRPVCRPNENQRAIYNGHKRVHSMKFQAVALPNGISGESVWPN